MELTPAATRLSLHSADVAAAALPNGVKARRSYRCMSALFETIAGHTQAAPRANLHTPEGPTNRASCGAIPALASAHARLTTQLCIVLSTSSNQSSPSRKFEDLMARSSSAACCCLHLQQAMLRRPALLLAAPATFLLQPLSVYAGTRFSFSFGVPTPEMPQCELQ